MPAALRIIAAFACLIVIAGFVTFASDSAGKASRGQQQLISTHSANVAAAQAPAAPRSGVSGFVDDANKVLLAPFASAGGHGDEWVSHTVPVLLALLLYGFGLFYLARILQGL